MPDLNSIPSSPSRSRRPTGTSISAASTAQPPAQAVSPGSINILPSNQQAVHNAGSSSALPSPALPSASSSGTMPIHSQEGTPAAASGAGPGPIRHPRPLTAAELHSELEQEQELLVNRLTRDLTMLRAANNSSVVSNASSASASATNDQFAALSFTDTHMLSGPGFHIPATSATDRRHHRTSSSTSARSFGQLGSAAAQVSSTSAPIPIPHHTSGSAASVLEAARNPRGAASSSMSRQNSTTSHRSQSRNHSPPPPGSGSYHHSYQQHHYQHGSGGGSSYDPTFGYFRGGGGPPGSSIGATPGSEAAVMSPGMLPATHRYEETAFYRGELDTAKRENETLRRRVRELEKMVRQQQRQRRDTSTSSSRQPQPQQAASATDQVATHPRERTDSMSTTTSAVSVSGGVAGAGGGAGGGGGTGIAPGRRGMERAVSSISYAGSVAVGVPEEEVKVGESAASSSGLRKPSIASSTTGEATVVQAATSVPALASTPAVESADAQK